MLFADHLASGRASLITFAMIAWLTGCAGPDAAGTPAYPEPDPTALASTQGAWHVPEPAAEPGDSQPAPVGGMWHVSTGGRPCALLLEVTARELAGYSYGCSKADARLPIAIGLISGGSLLFQTGEGLNGWIWTGRFDPNTLTLAGWRENIVTGELEQFLARR